jgi:hypothetical protein
MEQDAGLDELDGDGFDRTADLFDELLRRPIGESTDQMHRGRSVEDLRGIRQRIPVHGLFEGLQLRRDLRGHRPIGLVAPGSACPTASDAEKRRQQHENARADLPPWTTCSFSQNHGCTPTWCR